MYVKALGATDECAFLGCVLVMGASTILHPSANSKAGRQGVMHMRCKS